MGRRWRGRRLRGGPRAVRMTFGCALLGAAALLASGCGAEERVNDPRPQPPTRVSVAVNSDRVIVQPRRVAFGPEPTQQIPQNRDAKQPQVDSDAPLNVVLTAANLTSSPSRLEVSGAAADARSEPLVAQGNVSMLAALPTGVYRVSVAGVPGVEPGRLVVGPYRSSSENDLLLP